MPRIERTSESYIGNDPAQMASITANQALIEVEAVKSEVQTITNAVKKSTSSSESEVDIASAVASYVDTLVELKENNIDGDIKSIITKKIKQLLS